VSISVKQSMSTGMVALGALGLLPAPSAMAVISASLPTTGFYQIVADFAHGHLFISQ
jgi:hypothetical protein